MREIKFRAWDGEKMVTPFCIAGGDGCWFSDGRNFEDWISHHGPLMQFTGLTDKNGREIYEGDVLETEFPVMPDPRPRRHVVEWHDEDNGWNFKPNLITQFGCSVIGNIWENGDLIDGQ